jgi:hypothetical protein
MNEQRQRREAEHERERRRWLPAETKRAQATHAARAAPAHPAPARPDRIGKLIGFGGGFDWISPMRHFFARRHWQKVVCHEAWWETIDYHRKRAGWRIRAVYNTDNQTAFLLHEESKQSFLDTMADYGWPQGDKQRKAR